jgi:hypothetical protein
VPFFLYIADAILMKNFFNLAAELCTFQRLGREVAPQILILQVLAYILKPFLPSMRIWMTDRRVRSSSLLLNLRFVVSMAMKSFRFRVRCGNRGMAFGRCRGDFRLRP